MEFKIIDTSEEELRIRQKEEEEEEYQERVLFYKKEFVSEILELKFPKKLISILRWEDKMYFLDDDNFIIENEEIRIKEDIVEEIILLRDTRGDDWD